MGDRILVGLIQTLDQSCQVTDEGGEVCEESLLLSSLLRTSRDRDHDVSEMLQPL